MIDRGVRVPRCVCYRVRVWVCGVGCVVLPSEINRRRHMVRRHPHVDEDYVSCPFPLCLCVPLVPLARICYRDSYVTTMLFDIARRFSWPSANSNGGMRWDARRSRGAARVDVHVLVHCLCVCATARRRCVSPLTAGCLTTLKTTTSTSLANSGTPVTPPHLSLRPAVNSHGQS